MISMYYMLNSQFRYVMGPERKSLNERKVGWIKAH